MRVQVSKVLKEIYHNETINIYQLFDNSVYLSSDSDGIGSLPGVKGADNAYRYPVIGRLVMVE
jgi:hypothetical protein